MKRDSLISLCAAVLLLACANPAGRQAAAAETHNPSATSRSSEAAQLSEAARTAALSAENAAAASPEVDELPLPEVPATLRTPAERADFIVGHFWDAMDFRDTLRARNADFIEQTFVNYVSIFPYAGDEARRSSVQALLKAAEADREACMLLLETAEKYLYDPNSPMLDENFYTYFLETVQDTPLLDRYEKMRYVHQLKDVRKNRAGMSAADFGYVTREGAAATLHATAVSGSLVLLFYDPECEHCREIVGALHTDPVLSPRVTSGEVKVLAVYAGGEESLWRSTLDAMPAEWTVAMSKELDGDERYVLRAMPTLYLLDREKRVVLKDVRPEILIDWLYSR